MMWWMENEPVAKRTRLSVSRYKNKRMNRTRELHQKVRVLYDDLMSKCNEVNQTLSNFKVNVQKLRQCVMRQKSEYKSQLFELEDSLKTVSHNLKYLQKQLFHTKQVMDNVFVDKLHPYECDGSRDCILKMQRKLKEDPLSLDRKEEIYRWLSYSDDSGERCTALHAAVLRGHVQCVKFLLESGAKVSSVTAEGATILDSLYNIDGSLYDEDKDRLDVLKLLLEYGVSSMFKKYIYAGEWALRTAVVKQVEEVSLLLQHGAVMDRQTSRSAIAEAWELFNLPAIRLLLLLHRNRLNFGPGSHALCPLIFQHCYYKMVLAGVPLDKCHEKLLEALELYKAFGGKFPVCSEKDQNQDLMQYLKSYKHRRHFNDIKFEIQALISNPLSLQEISRLVVRKCIRKGYVGSTKKLEVPQALQSFLMFDDVTITEIPEKFDEFGEDTYPSSSGEEDSDMEL